MKLGTKTTSLFCTCRSKVSHYLIDVNCTFPKSVFIHFLNIAKYICCIATGYQVIMVPCDSDIVTSLEEKNNI